MVMEIIWAALASLSAGFVDAIVGGGGLILIPALFTLFPSAPPATLLGVNKGSSVWGTAAATWAYAKQVRLPWRSVGIGAICAFGGSLFGAWLVTQMSPVLLRQLLPLALVVVLVYTILKKDLGQHHRPRFSGRQETIALAAIGGVIGCYDGFFGPGTGSFLVFALVRVLGYDFMHASASAKLLNTASNCSALLFFVVNGHIWWGLVAITAIANVIGSVLGTRLALKHGTGFVRWFFIAVVSALIVKTGC
jgi:hypothetical protein